MAINIKQTDASVNGSTLILTETEESLATTPLAEVPTDTALDSIIGVKDGVPKQVALADMKAAIDALETVQTSSASGNGLTLALAKRYGVCTLTVTGGSLTSDISGNTAIVALPNGFRPSMTVEFPTSNLTNGCRMSVSTGGAFMCVNMNLTAGTYIRGSVTYVCA